MGPRELQAHGANISSAGREWDHRRVWAKWISASRDARFAAMPNGSRLPGPTRPIDFAQQSSSGALGPTRTSVQRTRPARRGTLHSGRWQGGCSGGESLTTTRTWMGQTPVREPRLLQPRSVGDSGRRSAGDCATTAAGRVSLPAAGGPEPPHRHSQSGPPRGSRRSAAPPECCRLGCGITSPGLELLALDLSARAQGIARAFFQVCAPELPLSRAESVLQLLKSCPRQRRWLQPGSENG